MRTLVVLPIAIFVVSIVALLGDAIASPQTAAITSTTAATPTAPDPTPEAAQRDVNLEKLRSSSFVGLYIQRRFYEIDIKAQWSPPTINYVASSFRVPCPIPLPSGPSPNGPCPPGEDPPELYVDTINNLRGNKPEDARLMAAIGQLIREHDARRGPRPNP